LADFQEHYDRFKDENIEILAGSVESESDTAEFAGDIGVEYPMAYGLECRKIAEELGCFFAEDRKYLQPTAYIIDPKGRVACSSYSSGPVGRMSAANALDLIEHYKKKERQ
jgi:alkyl hydroperoxide reductase subunit AhpC